MTTGGDIAIETLRDKVRQVSEQARYITIRKDRIADFTDVLLKKYPLITSMNDNHFLSAAYVFALDSINFGSAWFDDFLTYERVARGLKHAFMQDEMNTADKWLRATPEMFRQIFELPAGKYEDLLKLFAHHMNVSGSMIRDFYEGDVLYLLEEAQGSAVRLVNTLGRWPTFHDVARLDGLEIPFMKRPQILAADIHLTFQGQGLGAFRDMNQLTIFADNMVPHVLRCEGILEYTPDLAARIDAGTEIAAGSREEAEIRATAIHAVELMQRTVAHRGITSINLDHILWHKGEEPHIAGKPTHRTKTVWY